MNIAEIKAAVDAGKSVYWSNAGYVVRKDILGQYLIIFEPNGSPFVMPELSQLIFLRRMGCACGEATCVQSRRCIV